jgi:hypothetical protein
LILKLEGENLAKLPIIALEDAPESGFFSRLNCAFFVYQHHE